MTNHARILRMAAVSHAVKASVLDGQYRNLRQTLAFQRRASSPLLRGRSVEAESRYHPSADQLALASTIDASLASLLPLSRLHASDVEDSTTWSSLEEIGLFGIAVSEQHGGSGLGAAEEALIAMGLGLRLAAPAVVATIGATHARQDGAAIDLAGRRVAAAYRSG